VVDSIWKMLDGDAFFVRITTRGRIVGGRRRESENQIGNGNRYSFPSKGDKVRGDFHLLLFRLLENCFNSC